LRKEKETKMSFYAVIMFTRWLVNTDEDEREWIEKMGALPMEKRKRDPSVEEKVKELFGLWRRGTRMERIATLGWLDAESIGLMCQVIEERARIRQEYQEEVARNGGVMPEMKDADFRAFMVETEKARDAMRKKI